MLGCKVCSVWPSERMPDQREVPEIGLLFEGLEYRAVKFIVEIDFTFLPVAKSYPDLKSVQILCVFYV